MENEHNNAVPEEKKPGYPMHKRKYTPLYTIIVFLSVPARSGDACAVRSGQRNSFHGQERAV